MAWVLKNLDENSPDCNSGIRGLYATKMDAINDYWNMIHGSDILEEEEYKEYLRFRDVMMEYEHDEATDMALCVLTEVKEGIQLQSTFAKSESSEGESSEESSENSEDIARLGLCFPDKRFTRMLGDYVPEGGSVTETAGIYIAAAIEYLVAEVLEMAGNVAASNRKHSRIMPRHIMTAIRSDEELNHLLRDVVYTNEGIATIPMIVTELPSVQVFQKDRYDQYGRPVPVDPVDMVPSELPLIGTTDTKL